MFKIKRKTTEINIKGHSGYNVKIYLTIFGFIYKLKFEYYLMMQMYTYYNGCLPFSRPIERCRRRSIFTLSSNTDSAYQEWLRSYEVVGYWYDYKTKEDLIVS